MSILELIFSYALGIASNASWDMVKVVCAAFRHRKNVDIQELWVKAFYEAVRRHGECFDRASARMLGELTRLISLDPSKLVTALTVISFEDYGQFLAAINSRHLAVIIAREIASNYDLHDGRDAQLLEGIVADVLTFYRVAVLDRISADEELRLVLLQTLKIDVVVNSILKLQQEVSSGRILGVLSLDALTRLSERLDALTAALNSQYIANRDLIDSAHLDLKHTVLVADLRRLLRAKGFSVKEIAASDVDIVAENHGVLGTRIAIVLEVSSVFAPVERIARFQGALVRLGASIGYFLSVSPLADSTIQVFSSNQTLRFYQVDDFLNGLVAIGPYMDRLEEALRSRHPFSKRAYIPPRGALTEAAPGEDLLTLISDRFLFGSRKMVALLGDFGVGKTTFCEHFCLTIISKYRDIGALSRIPVLVSLRRFDRVMDVRSAIVQAVQEVGLDINLALLDEMLVAGRFVFLFDGLDEMTLRTDKLTVLDNIRALQAVIEKGDNRVLLTCRSHLFRENIEESYLDAYDIVYIRPWDYAQIGEYVRSVALPQWNTMDKVLRDNPGLIELCRTPLFNDMVLQSLEYCNSNEASLYGLFEEFTEKWIRAQDRRSRMSPHEKRKLMADLATSMFYRGVYSVHYSELRGIVQQQFHLQSMADIDYFDNDVRTCSFLVRDTAGYYRFCHRAFMEFFVSRVLRDELAVISHELRAGSGIGEWYFHRKKLTKEICCFLAETRVIVSDLSDIVRWTAGRTFREVCYLGANAATLLKYLNADLRHSKFSGSVLRDVNLSSSDLTGANFRGADLYTSNFTNCVLDNVDMTDAELGYASLKGFSGILSIVPIADGRICIGSMRPEIVVVESPEYCRTVAVLSGHSDGVRAMAHFRASNLLISAGRDHSVRLWDSGGYQLLRTFDGHDDNVWAVAADDRSGLIVSGSSDCTVKVWEVGRNSAVATLVGHTAEVRGVDFLDDGTIVSCGLDGKVIAWKWRTSSQAGEWHSGQPLHSLSCAREADVIALGDAAGSVWVLKASTFEELRKARLHEGTVRSVDVSEDGRQIISGGGDCCVSLFDVTNGIGRILFGHNGFVNTLSWARGDSTVVSGGYDNHLTVLNVMASVKQRVDLGDMLYPSGSRFSCKGLRLQGSTGLSSERLAYLRERGAILA